MAAPCPGHVGTIYQAANARFTGRSSPRTLVVLPGGDVLPERSLSKERGHEHVERRLVALGAPARRMNGAPAAWLARALPAVGAVRVRHRGCYRYAFALGRTRRERQGVLIAPGPSPYLPEGARSPAGCLAS